MIAFAPENGHSDQIPGSLLEQLSLNARQPQSRLRPPSGNGDNGEPTKVSHPRPRLPNGDNGKSTRVSRPGPRLPNGDNGEIAGAECGHGQETVLERAGIERRSRLGPPIETASNGKAQIGANERPSRLGPPLETGDNGNAQITENERRLSLRPRLPTGANGEIPVDPLRAALR
jgi:hypothetical protein